MKFKIGDKVELIKNDGMAAKIGARAKVVGYKKNDEFGKLLVVEWINGGKVNGQLDGGYFPPHFKKVGLIQTKVVEK